MTPSIGVISWELPELHAAEGPPSLVVMLYLWVVFLGLKKIQFDDILVRAELEQQFSATC